MATMVSFISFRTATMQSRPYRQKNDRLERTTEYGRPLGRSKRESGPVEYLTLGGLSRGWSIAVVAFAILPILYYLYDEGYFDSLFDLFD